MPDSVFDAVKTTADAFGGETSEADRTLEFQDTRFVRGDEFEIERAVDPADRTGNLQTVEAAAERADLVLVYLHQHHWEPDRLDVGDWLREFARGCIDAGAHAFLGHGVPLMQPVELYKQKPVCYSLGNFIFHCSDPTYWSDPWCWQSVVLQGEFAAGEWVDLSARPLALAKSDTLATGDFVRIQKRHCPMAAAGDQATVILERLRDISEPYETEVVIDDEFKRLSIEN